MPLTTASFSAAAANSRAGACAPRGGVWIKAPGRPGARLDSGEALRDAAQAGLGVALLPDFLVAGDLDAGRLQEVLPGFDAGEVEVVALYPSRRLLGPRVRRSIDLLIEDLGA